MLWAKRHDEEFKSAITGAEGSFPFVAFSNLEMIRVPKINFDEDGTLSQTINEILDTGDRVAVLDRHAIELLVVNAHPEGAILLLYKEDQRTTRSLGGVNSVIG
jgi:hypothetical protein